MENSTPPAKVDKKILLGFVRALARQQAKKDHENWRRANDKSRDIR